MASTKQLQRVEVPDLGGPSVVVVDNYLFTMTGKPAEAGDSPSETTDAEIVEHDPLLP